MKSNRTAMIRCLAGAILLAVGAWCWADEPPLPGDANNDGVVNGADYTIWADNYEPGVVGKTWGQGDFNNDGIVDGGDYTIWSDNYNAVPFRADIQLYNNTGSARTNWPVLLTVWKVFGANLDLDKLNPAGFHVYDETGAEVPHMIRPIPPNFSLGNDEIVFIVPQMAAGQTLNYRVTNTSLPGMTQPINLIDNPNNMLPNGGFETDTGGVPTGYYVASGSASTISYDTTTKHSGTRSMKLTLPVGMAVTLKTSGTMPIGQGLHYHFSIWGKTDNVAYTGYGFVGGGRIKFESTAFTGRSELTLRDYRPWFCYRFDSDDPDAWGVPGSGSKGIANRQVRLSLSAYQEYKPFLTGAMTGTIWLDEALLLVQPKITVDRQTPLANVAKNGAVIVTRPANMPRYKAFAHETASSLKAFAMRGQRHQLRFGVHAVQTLQNVQVYVTPLNGPGGQLSGGNLDLERLGSFVENYASLIELAAGNTAEYLLGIDVPAGLQPGTYKGLVIVTAGTQTLGVLSLEMEVLPIDVPAMEGTYVGGVYNVGYPLDRDDAFYTCYGKVRFNFLMLFDYFSTHMIGDEIDLAGAQQQVDKMATLAHVTGGIGLYREPNMSRDQPRKWYQIASNTEFDPVDPYGSSTTDPQYMSGYQDLAEQLETYAIQNNWPDMIYMVSDEPDRAADVDPSMGWLNDRLPNAITNCDAQYRDMVKTWSWYNLPVLDDPADWTGPLMYDYVRANSGRFGICGTALGLSAGRYQPGLMMASSGACYWHWWHTQRAIQDIGGKVLRMHHVAAMGAGANDLRYYLVLKDRIANCTNPALATAAQAWLDDVFSFCSADHDRHLLPYNGVPVDWGYDRWYDDWRSDMKDIILMLPQ